MDGRLFCSEGLEEEAWKIEETPVEICQDDQALTIWLRRKKINTLDFCDLEGRGLQDALATESTA